MTRYAKLAAIHQRFVDGLMLGAKGAAVVRELKPKLKRPDVQSAKWLARPDIKAALEERKALSTNRALLTQERWDEEVATIAYHKCRKSDIRASDKNKALEMAGRRLGLYKDSAGERTPIGPGLTVVVQVVQAALGPPALMLPAVSPRLPGPGK